MRANRSKRKTQELTEHLLKAVRQDSPSWLGHTKGACAIDYALIQGATEAELMAIRKTFKNHIAALRKKHSLTIEVVDGVYRFSDRQVP